MNIRWRYKIFKIGEFSKLTQVSARMLRYYDEAGLLKPDTVDRFTGYRMYSASQIEKLNKIVFLRDIGFNVAEIAVTLNDWSEDGITQALINKRTEIANTILAEQEKIIRIDSVINDLQKAYEPLHHDVMIKAIPSYFAISLRKTIENYFAEGLLWKELSAKISSYGIKIPQNELNIALYHDEDYRETDVDVEVCTIVPEHIKITDNDISCKELEPVPQMACVMVHGSFYNIAPAFQSLADWLSKHKQYCMSKQPNRQICHRGPWNEENPENYLTEIQIAIEKISY